MSTSDPKQVRAGEFGCVDVRDRIVCRLDSLQADFSKVTPQTTDALLIIESTTAQTHGQRDRDLADVAAAIERYCGCVAEVVAAP